VKIASGLHPLPVTVKYERWENSEGHGKQRFWKLQRLLNKRICAQYTSSQSNHSRVC